jgi:hypothetical protein
MRPGAGTGQLLLVTRVTQQQVVRQSDVYLCACPASPAGDSAALTLSICLVIMSRRASAHGRGMYSCLGKRRRAASSSS